MKRQLAAICFIGALVVVDVLATCGGGGGGGTGGMGGGAMGSELVYQVPWTLGDRNKALALLKRHFFEYEKYDAVRSKEMMEARVDAVFASILTDPEFLTLTAGADGKLPMPRGR